MKENSACHAEESFTMATGELLEVIEEGSPTPFYFEITVDPYAVAKNNPKRFHIHYIQLLPTVTPCITVVQYFDIDTIIHLTET